MAKKKTLKTFDDIYHETYQNVLKYVVLNCNNIDNVQDIIQNIYLEVLKILKTKKEITLTKEYIMGITKHKVKDYYRFKYKMKIVSLFNSKDKEDSNIMESIPTNIDIEKSSILKEDITFIWNYLSKKKVIVSKVFYLYFYLGYSLSEIASELNVSESNVKNYLYRTINELNFIMKKGD